MTFAELKAALLRRLRERSGALVWVTAADVDQALNDGYMELSDATEWYETHQTVDLLGLRPYYDARTVLDAPLLSLGAAFHADTNRWLIPTTPRALDRFDRRWERRVAVPDHVYTRGLWWISYWPRVGADVGTVRQYYTALPDPLSDDADEPGFPPQFHMGIVEFATADLLAQDGETDQALVTWGEYLKHETGLEGWVQERLNAAQRHGYV